MRVQLDLYSVCGIEDLIILCVVVADPVLYMHKLCSFLICFMALNLVVHDYESHSGLH